MSSMQIDRLLGHRHQVRRVDFHLTVGRPPRCVCAHLRTSDQGPRFRRHGLARRRSRLKATSRNSREKGGTDFGFACGDAARFRVSIFRQRGDIAIVLRQIPSKLLTFEQIGLPVYVPGTRFGAPWHVPRHRPTSSGKTDVAGDDDRLHQPDVSTAHRDDGRPDRVLPLPQEIDRQPARDPTTTFPSFGRALRRVLRSGPRRDPGRREMRDLETIEAAIRAAETGHLVFGTLHTTGAAKTIDRLVDAFPVTQQNQIRPALDRAHLRIASSRCSPRIDREERVAAYGFLVVTPCHRQPHPATTRPSASTR